MKKVLALVAVVSLMAAATVASAATIKNSKHDLSSGSTATFRSSGTNPTNQICVFCHTPHNAIQNGYPLWNRSAASGSFLLYSSGNMKNQYGAQKASQGFTTVSVSLYCMSCHDGGLVAGRIHNLPLDNGKNIPGMTPGDNITSTANLGTDLRNDHPVNFNIVNFGGAIGTSQNGGKAIGGLTTTNLPLFNSGRGTSSLECASCHAVHDPGYVPFLRTTNNGSYLCLTCHNK